MWALVRVPEPSAPEVVSIITPQPPAIEESLPKEPPFTSQGSIGTNQEKILFYLSCADYLSTSQIVDLVYAHLKDGSRAAAASRDLRKLIAARKIFLHPSRMSQQHIYTVSRTARPTAHNLAVRDLFVKIVTSGIDIEHVAFAPASPGLTPDLAVRFAGGDGYPIETFWEYDAGTEGIEEIRSKIRRHEALGNHYRITFIVDCPKRLARIRQELSGPHLAVAEMKALACLDDPVFWIGIAGSPLPFWASEQQYYEKISA